MHGGRRSDSNFQAGTYDFTVSSMQRLSPPPDDVTAAIDELPREAPQLGINDRSDESSTRAHLKVRYTHRLGYDQNGVLRS